MSQHCPGCKGKVNRYPPGSVGWNTSTDAERVVPCPGCGHEKQLAEMNERLQQYEDEHGDPIAADFRRTFAAEAALKRAEAELAALRAALARAREANVWKSGPPSVPGWYWFRNLTSGHDIDPYIVRLRDYAGKLAIDNSYLEGWKRFETGEWAGPIQPPAGETREEDGE